MHRFFLEQELSIGKMSILDRHTTHQVQKVLRMRNGDRLILFNGTGTEWLAVVNSMDIGQVVVTLLEERLVLTEPVVKLRLCQGLLKSDRFEFVVQKATELGVHSIQPIVTRRSIADSPSKHKASRWSRIAKEAAELAGRVWVPHILPAKTLESAVTGRNGPSITLWEGERKVSLQEAVENITGNLTTNLSLFIGPEGGFEVDEAEFMDTSGSALASFGKRILRADTAGIAAVALVMYEVGDLGRRLF